jgi:hypothetical protein
MRQRKKDLGLYGVPRLQQLLSECLYVVGLSFLAMGENICSMIIFITTNSMV